MPKTRFALALLLVAAFAAPSLAQDKPRKVAFLVGVGKFKHDLKNLDGSPQKDVAELEKVLKGGGFEVITLTDEKATKDAIEARFKAVVDGGANRANALAKGDVLLVAICTHGFTLSPAAGKPGEPFVAGYDAKSGEASTMVALNALIDTPKKSGATCLFLIDACREETDPNRGQTRGVEPTRATLPKGTAVLFACGQGQVSHQHKDADGHGLFTFAVLRTLKPVVGGRVSWNKLVTGVEEEFHSNAFRRMLPKDRPQVPVLASGELGAVTLFEFAPRSAESQPTTPGGTKVVENKSSGTADDPPPPRKPVELAEEGKARVKPAGGAEAIQTTALRTGGKNLRVPYLDKGAEVTVKELVGSRCRVAWIVDGTDYEGWLDKKDLVASDK